jgi:hypothetical protein
MLQLSSGGAASRDGASAPLLPPAAQSKAGPTKQTPPVRQPFDSAAAPAVGVTGTDLISSTTDKQPTATQQPLQGIPALQTSCSMAMQLQEMQTKIEEQQKQFDQDRQKLRDEAVALQRVQQQHMASWQQHELDMMPAPSNWNGWGYDSTIWDQAWPAGIDGQTWSADEWDSLPLSDAPETTEQAVGTAGPDASASHAQLAAADVATAPDDPLPDATAARALATAAPQVACIFWGMMCCS